jgi:ArsR family transcriptional regulator
MPHTRKTDFSDADNCIAQYAKALAHPARVAIIRLLAQKQTCICGDIVDDLPLSQSTVSQHLKALKDAGLIQGNIEGVTVCYCLNSDALATIKALFGNLFDYILQGKKCC